MESAVEKSQQQIEAEKDKKKVSALEKRMENLKGSVVPLQDTEK